ncbi:hypothetical protein [Rufibacter immobilis]|uniref:hypothetical protein n=1 Tax=Rufibacter immobilis TaxID=1348778 RepID=UPI0035E67A98
MDSIKETLHSIGEAMRLHMIYVLEEEQKYPLDRNNSTLLKTLKVQVNQARNSLGQFQGFAPNSQVVLWAQKYIQWVDSGRKPFAEKVPIAALLSWIKKKKLKGRVRNGKGKGQFISDNKLAFMIRNSIYKNGIRGRHFIQPAFDKGTELFDIYINNQLLDDMTYELDKALKFIE